MERIRTAIAWDSTTKTSLSVVALVSLAVVLVFAAPVAWISIRHVDLLGADRLDAEAAARSSVLQLLGATILIAGLFFTARTLQLTREGHITDRYASAIEQLGHVSTDVRLGGIFALERVARDSPADRDTIIDVLTAYVRTHTTISPREPKLDHVDVDVQAAITVLGRRPGAETDRHGLDLTHCGLTGADLRGKFDGAMFHYSVLDNAIFTGGSFVGAGLSFTSGRVVGFNHADARNAHFVHARIVQSWFINTDLTGADFYGCDLTGTDMGQRYDESGSPAPASRLDGARFENATLTDTILRGSDLRSVRGLTAAQVAAAQTDGQTRLPVSPPASGD